MALRARGAWRAPLPTVDETSEAEVAAAVLRGRRSLAVRELAAPDGTVLGTAAQVLTALGTGPSAVFMLVDADSDWMPGGLTIYLYGTAPAQVEMSHVVAAAGVHYFRVQPPPDQWRALTDLAQAVFDDGFTEAADGARQPAAAVLSVAGQAGLRSVRVAHGTASTVRSPEPVTFTTLAEAVGWMAAPAGA